MSHTADVGDEVLVATEVRNIDGELVNAATVVLTVTLPDLTTATPVVDNPSTGHYEVAYTLAQAGRYVFSWATTNPNTAEASAIAAVAASNLPNLTDVDNYLGESATQWTPSEKNDVLLAETAAQARVCRIKAEYPRDLREALLRRVQRNLAMRALPLAVLQGDAEVGSAILPGRDPEVRRLEAPHRKLVLG